MQGSFIEVSPCRDSKMISASLRVRRCFPDSRVNDMPGVGRGVSDFAETVPLGLVSVCVYDDALPDSRANFVLQGWSVVRFTTPRQHYYGSGASLRVRRCAGFSGELRSSRNGAWCVSLHRDSATGLVLVYVYDALEDTTTGVLELKEIA